MLTWKETFYQNILWQALVGHPVKMCRHGIRRPSVNPSAASFQLSDSACHVVSSTFSFLRSKTEVTILSGDSFDVSKKWDNTLWKL